MKSMFSRIALAAALAVSLAAFAQDGAAAAKPPAATPASDTPAASLPAATKVGIIDIQGAIQACNEGQRDIEALNKKFEPKQQELAKLNTDIQGLQTQLKAQGEKMNDDARNQLAKQIEQKQRSLQQGAEGAQADYQSEANDIGTRIGQKIMKVLDKYAKENGYVVILSVSDQQTPVLWANLQAADVTQKVIELYNKESGVPAPAPSAPRPSTGAGAAARPPATGAPRPAVPGATATPPKKP
ncbi:MAG: OmpH family outer membrane protein [Acidobacteria bacterium]|nr:OmpH family outer membrane protein [Acidobacteriota bacterium]